MLSRCWRSSVATGVPTAIRGDGHLPHLPLPSDRPLPVLEILVILCLILLNGFYAMSELAVVSARCSRLEQMSKEGRRGADAALRLIDDPTGFLSTVQVGITLVGIFAGAYGGSVLAEPLAALLAEWPLIGPYAQTVAFVAVVVAITYLSLVFGELVPKRFALRRAETIAAAVAPFMNLLARIGAPLVWLLRASTETVSSLLGSKADDSGAVTEEDVRAMIAEGTRSGVFEPKERQMLEGVIRIADRTARSIMVPRPDVVWVGLDDSAETVLDEIVAAGHSRFPVVDAESNDVVGIVQTKDLLEQQRRGGIDLRSAMRDALYVHETMPILALLERFRATRIHLAVVLDEYGSLEGIVTPTDILVAIAGALPESLDGEPGMVQRPDGSWLVDATMSVDAVADSLPRFGFLETRDYRPWPASRSTGSAPFRRSANASPGTAGRWRSSISTAAESTSCCCGRHPPGTWRAPAPESPEARFRRSVAEPPTAARCLHRQAIGGIFAPVDAKRLAHVVSADPEVGQEIVRQVAELARCAAIGHRPDDRARCADNRLARLNDRGGGPVKEGLLDDGHGLVSFSQPCECRKKRGRRRHAAWRVDRSDPELFLTRMTIRIRN